MKNLVESLRQQTASFKAEYLERVNEAAANEFAFYSKVVKWGVLEWCKYFGIEAVEVCNVSTFNRPQTHYPKNFYNSAKAKTQYNLKSKASGVVRLGLEAFTAKALKAAEVHYEAATEKLAYRIVEKGLNPEAAVVSSGRVGVNMEVTVNDGAKTVRAFTVVASGEVQKPHYRYLIK